VKIELLATVLLASALTSCGTTARSREVLGLQDFEACDLDVPPAGFTAATTVGDLSVALTPSMRDAGVEVVATPAKWAVVEDADAPSGRRVLKLVETRNREEVFNLVLRDEPAPADVELRVKIRPDSGRDDRGGGLVWRARDAANFYLARWNPLEKNLRVYCVRAGHRIQIRSVPLVADPAAWHTLAVAMHGRVIDVSFDGKHVTDCADTTFVEPGQVGLWTRGDAASSFDDFEVRALTTPR
jgi:hypothetical protein